MTQERNTGTLTSTALMQRILEVRYTDLQEERDLCKQLLDTAETEQNIYGSAFANVYMLDALLALGDYQSCSFYLARALYLCQEHGYNELMLTLCNFAGLYYTKLNDEQAALDYYLDGLKLARQAGDAETESKLLNNLGFAFGGRDDWASAKDCFQQATEAARRGGTADSNIVSYLCNAAESCSSMGDFPGAQQILVECSALPRLSLYHQLRLACAWCAFYARQADAERCRLCEARLHELNFLEYENKFFVYDMCTSIAESMLNIGDLERARGYLDILERASADSALTIRFATRSLAVRYWKSMDNREALTRAYREYYETEQQVSLMDDQARAQSMLSQIQLAKVRQEREAMRSENRELEHASQRDELTGLYNRRYFTKLVSKATQEEGLYSLGFLMLDVDYFKQYNDHYGHFAGDTALKSVSEILLQNAGNGVYVSRYGGDEFICLCVNMRDEEVDDFIARVERDLRRREIPHEKSACGKLLSLSIGYCNEPVRKGVTPDALLNLADEALYHAKVSGRNCHARKQLLLC